MKRLLEILRTHEGKDRESVYGKGRLSQMWMKCWELYQSVCAYVMQKCKVKKKSCELK